jgi:hypothetical protein
MWTWPTLNPLVLTLNSELNYFVYLWIHEVYAYDSGCKLVPERDKGPFEEEVNDVGVQQDPNQILEGPKA